MKITITGNEVVITESRPVPRLGGYREAYDRGFAEGCPRSERLREALRNLIDIGRGRGFAVGETLTRALEEAEGILRGD